MQEYNDQELEILGLQIGCIVRVGRLRKGLSQQDLGLMIGSNNTTIGRIERFENSTSWKNLFKVCQILQIDFNSLFILQPLKLILLIIKECVSLEQKLTAEKKKYYKLLEESAYIKYKKNNI